MVAMEASHSKIFVSRSLTWLPTCLKSSYWRSNSAWTVKFYLLSLFSSFFISIFSNSTCSRASSAFLAVDSVSARLSIPFYSIWCIPPCDASVFSNFDFLVSASKNFWRSWFNTFLKSYICFVFYPNSLLVQYLERMKASLTTTYPSASGTKLFFFSWSLVFPLIIPSTS